MEYKVLKTNRFKTNLYNIVTYIKDEFSSKEAIDYLDYLEEQIKQLSIFPFSGTIPRASAIAKQGYRVLISKQNLIFYKVDNLNNTIVLYSIVSSTQDYINLL